MEKRGQFFLIAALLISGIAIGLGTLYNTAYVERADTQVYDLSEELYAELQQTYDSGLVRGDSKDEIQKNIARLAQYYQEQNPDSTFIIFYGNEKEICKVESRGADVAFVKEGGTSSENCIPLSSSSSAITGAATARSTLFSTATQSLFSTTRLALVSAESKDEKKENPDKNKPNTQPAPSPKENKDKEKKRIKLRIAFKEKPLPAGASPTTPRQAKATANIIESPAFEVKPGNNFYFVIRKKVKNEQVIVYRQ